MLMDVLHLCAEESRVRTERTHFHEFLQGIHLELHAQRKATGAGGQDAIFAVAEGIAARTDLLCFDELAITTIQDCCLVTPLFKRLWEKGVTTVATSNRKPEDLYQGGLNRHMHLPSFLEALHAKCTVLELGGDDYRR